MDFQIGLTYVDTYIKENDKKSIPYLTEEFSGSYKMVYYNNFIKLKFDLTGNIVGTNETSSLSALDPRPGYSPTFNILNLQVTKKFQILNFLLE